jgi:general secretion pathway protein A
MPQLTDRLAARCLLKPLSQEETLSYVNHRLNAARASRPIFDTPALEALHELSHGNPRRINRLADLALLVGFADELPAIGRSQVEAVAEELSLAAA